MGIFQKCLIILELFWDTLHDKDAFYLSLDLRWDTSKFTFISAFKRKQRIQIIRKKYLLYMAHIVQLKYKKNFIKVWSHHQADSCL
jgi:hypothetical protein